MVGTLQYININSKKSNFYKPINLIQWSINDKNFIKNLFIPIFKKYPPLTSRFYCQIKYLEKSIDNFTVKDYILTKNTKYNFQIIHSNIINNFIYFDKLPNYFEQWLGGFIETKGSFNVININKNYSFTISQNKDYYLLQIIIKFYESKIKIKQISDIY